MIQEQVQLFKIKVDDVEKSFSFRFLSASFFAFPSETLKRHNCETSFNFAFTAFGDMSTFILNSQSFKINVGTIPPPLETLANSVVESRVNAEPTLP
jgi:hypothetical protein